MLAIKVFKLLTTATKLLHNNRVLPSIKFSKLVLQSNRTLTGGVYVLADPRASPHLCTITLR